MLRHIAAQPFFLLMLGISGLAMFMPAAHASAHGLHGQARAFFYFGTLVLILVTLIGVARAGAPRRRSLLHNLLALCAAFTVLPVVLAVPFYEALGTTTFVNAYLEMVSSVTTTGATLFAPDRLSDSLHLWRALVGWLGGLLMWVATAAVLAPLSLGGFELTASGEPGQVETARSDVDPHQRILRVAGQLFPVYLGLTAALWLLMVIVQEPPFTALCHAMAVMATSGISPVGGAEAGVSGLPGELLMALFMLFALSRITFSSDTLVGAKASVLRDSEFRLGAVLVLAVPAVLFLRHWVAAYGVDEVQNLTLALRAFWGALFTTLSFLSTTGFVSADWAEAQNWSGLATPGLILMGIAMIGGGVATTAGGVKLLRVWALYLQGLREMERMVHPNSVGRSGGARRRLRRQGAYVAWVFFMLFAATITLVTLLLAGIMGDFEQALILAVAGLSTTGPLVGVASSTPIALMDMAPAAKLVFAGAMIVGRLEMLAIIALIASDLWRR